MKYSKERLSDAVKSVKDGVYSYRKASEVFGIPKTTIIEYATGRGDETKKSKRRPAIPIEIEDTVAKKVVDTTDKGFGITKKKKTTSCKSKTSCLESTHQHTI